RCKMIAVTVHGLDDGLFIRIIANGTTRFHHASCKCRFGDDRSRPQLILQLVLIDGAMAIANKVQQQLEGFGLHGNDNTGTLYLATVHVDFAIAESVSF
ncbi:MAG: hypothetical protein OEW73_16050, partial [Gammaproteobacteria bacterium]|nr:hypothetical protein [Gammaproteobacteria bacterium]